MQKVDAAAKKTKSSLEDVDGTRVEATAKLDDQTTGPLGKLQGLLNRFGGSRYEAKAGVEANEGGLSRITAALNRFGGMRVEATAGVRADEGGLSRITAMLDRFSGRRAMATAGVNVDDAQLSLFDHKLNAIDGSKATANVDVDSAAGTAKLGIFSGLVSAVGRLRPTVTIDVDMAAAVGQLVAFTGVATAASSASNLMTTSTSGSVLMYTALTGAVIAAMAAIGPLLGGLAATAAMGVAGAAGLGMMGGAAYVMAQGLYDGGAAMAALSAAASATGAMLVQALGPASVIIGQVGVAALSVANGYIPLMGASATATATLMQTAFGEFFNWLSTSGEGVTYINSIFASIAPIMDALTRSALAFGQGLIAILGAAAPYAVQLAQYIQQIAYAFSTWAQSAEGQAQITAFIEMAIPVFQALWDMVVGVGGALLTFAQVSGGDVATAINVLTAIITGVISGFTWLYQTVGGAGIAFGLLAVAAAAIVVVIASVIGVIAALGAPVIAVIAVIMGLAVLATVLYNAWTPVATFFSTIGASIASGLATAGAAIASWVASVGAYFSGLGASILGALTAAFSTVAGVVVPIVTTIVTGIVTAFTGLVAGIVAIVTMVSQALIIGFTMIWSVLGPVLLIGIALIIGIFYYLFVGIQTVLTTINTYIIAFFTALWALISPIIMAGIAALLVVWNLLVAGIQLVWTAIQTAAVAFWTALVAIITPVIEAFITGITTIFNGLVTALQVVWDAISAAATAVWTAISGVVTPIVQAIVDAVVAAWTTLQSTTETVWTAIQTAIEAAWNYINDTVITPIVTAIVDFLTTSWETIRAAAETAWTAIQTVIETVWNYINDTIITPIVTAIIDFLATSWTTIQDAAQVAWDAISTLISDTWTTIQDLVSTAVTALTDAVQSGWDTMVEAATSFGSAFLDAVTEGFQTAVNKGLEIIATLLEAAGAGLSALGGVGEEIGGTLTSAGGTVRGYMFADGGVVGFQNGGGAGGMGTTGANSRLHLWNEQIGPEAYIAKNGPRNAQLNYLNTAAGWFGMGLSPFKCGGAAGMHDGRAGQRISGNTYVEGRGFCDGGTCGARCSCNGSLQMGKGGIPVVANQLGNLLGWDCLSDGILGYSNSSSVDADSAASSWNSAGANVQPGSGVSIIDSDLGGAYGGMTTPGSCTIEIDTWSQAQGAGYGMQILLHEMAHAFGQDHNALDSVLNGDQMYAMSGLGGDDPALAGEIFGVFQDVGAGQGMETPTLPTGTGGGTTEPGTGGTGGNSKVVTNIVKNIQDIQNTGKATGKGASINVGGKNTVRGTQQGSKIGAVPPAPGAKELRDWTLSGADSGNFDKLGMVNSFQLGGTHYGYSPEAQQSMEKANSACGNCGTPNTYYGHSYRAGCPEENNIDFWGSGGRGDPIDYSCGNCIRDAAMSDPNITYTIWDGILSDVGAWPDDPHYDHVHTAFCGGGGGGGVICKALRAAGQKLLDEAQAVAQAGVSALGADQPIQGGLDWIMSDGWDKVEEWIISQLPVCGGSGSGGGDCAGQLDNAINQLGLEGQGYESSMPTLIQGESGGDPNIVNSESGATGCGQMMPDTFDAFKVAGCDSITDPLCNLMASMNYQEQQYNGPVDWNAGGYANGGLVPSDGLIAAHGGERVLTTAQTAAFDDLVYNRLPGIQNLDTDGGGGGQTVIVNNHINNPSIGHEYTLDEFRSAMEETGYRSAAKLMKDVGDRRQNHSGRIARRRT